MFMRKLRMERKKKGSNYCNKSSKETKLRVKVVDISRCLSDTSKGETKHHKWK